jgi:hypothetical protein
VHGESKPSQRQNRARSRGAEPGRRANFRDYVFAQEIVSPFGDNCLLLIELALRRSSTVAENPNISKAACGLLLSFLAINLFVNEPAFAGQGEKERTATALDRFAYTAAPDPIAVQREAEARKAIAEADRAELLARLPPATSRPLPGSVDTKAFGAAGLVKAFDLAQQLAVEVCSVLPAEAKTVLYDPASTQGIVAARTVNDSIVRLGDDLSRQNKELQAFIETHTPPGTKVTALSFLALTVVPATVKAAADVTSLFKTDITAAGIAYGEGARDLFATSLSHACPDRIAGLSSGYLGELDSALHEKLLARVRTLASQRGEFANRIAILLKLAEAAKGDEKKDLVAVANASGAVLKTVDAFIDSLKAGEISDKGPLFNAARYLGYANRTAGAMVLDFDLRLEGMTIVKDNLFTGQHLRLSGVAFLWYRLYEANGTLKLANAVRRITAPVDVNLRGQQVSGEFWTQDRGGTR